MLRHSLLLAAACAASTAPAPAQAAAALRIACDGGSAGAEVSVNGQFKGECPLDVQVEPGEIRLRAVKAEGRTKERVFEQTLRLGDGVVKRVEIELGAAQWTAEGRRIEDERLRAEAERKRLIEERQRAEAEAKRLEEDERKRAVAARVAAAVETLVAAGLTPGSGARFRDCEACPAMTWLPAGEFKMGDDRYERTRPAHNVVFDRPFAVGAFEVTYDEWDACVRDGGCGGYTPNEGRTKRTLLPDRRWGRGRLPVVNVTIADARAYVDWLSRKTGKPYRLLSEAEWEYACMAGRNTSHCGGEEAEASAIAWFPANSDEQAHPVGEKRPNAWGLHDMSGNAWEWLQDCWHSDYKGAPADGSAWTVNCAKEHAARGGSWYRSQGGRARGYSSAPMDRENDNQGLRVARSLLP